MIARDENGKIRELIIPEGGMYGRRLLPYFMQDWP